MNTAAKLDPDGDRRNRRSRFPLFTPPLALSWLLALAGPASVQAAHPSLAALADAKDPVVLLHLADLHVTGPESMAEFKQVIAFANAAIQPTLTYVAGDTPDGGTPAQYAAYQSVMDTLQSPVVNVAGDHEARGDGLAHYRKWLGEPTYAFAVGRYQVVGLNSTGLDEQQLSWARKELTAARAKGRINLMFIHHNLAGLKDKTMAEQLNTLVKDTGVKLVLAGHTHNNIVINDGAGLQITTTSLKAPHGTDGKGYALVTLDEGRIAWHYVPLDQRPVVAICNPISKLMATGAEGLASGAVEVRVKAFDTAAITRVTATLNDGAPLALKKTENQTWTAIWDSSTVPDGEARLTVEAVNADGQSAREAIVFQVSQARQYVAAPVTVSDGQAGGAKGEKKPKGDNAEGGPPEKGPKGKKQTVVMADLPAVANTALRAHSGRTEFSKLEKELKDGREMYIAKWPAETGENEARIAADGTVLETKDVIPVDKLPATIRTALARERPQASLQECKRITKPAGGTSQMVFELKTEVNGAKQPPLKIAADGTVTQGKEKAPKDGKQSKEKA